MIPLVGWHPHETWTWLTTSPLLGLTLTVGAYAAGRWVHRRTGNALLQPVLVAVVLVGAVLLLADVPYDDYMNGGRFVAFWLGPATVALALPLHEEWHLVRRAAVPILTGVVVAVFAALVVRPTVGVVLGALVVAALRWPRLRRWFSLLVPAFVVLAGLYIAVLQARRHLPPIFEWPTLFGRARTLGWLAVIVLAADVAVEIVTRRRRSGGRADR